ncbi:SH3 domain-containing protein [Streptomyces sp. NBC_01549]|uniref:SH3 domain-containing protein n=1 Tax=Streptomyces sp. NBC_01549 TaxID=2975874 RepID=UPI00225817E4|nr:SH3 domain-containing protein [Streptomyces sp. NBC_01549]MCX4595906.1 SH3 domain-containing protein [Streptomyces sp. NBC_01549]
MTESGRTARPGNTPGLHHGEGQHDHEDEDQGFATAGVGALATGLLLTGAAGAQAAAAGLPYAVTPYVNVNVRYGPSTTTGIAGHVTAGQPRGASCWTHGETIRDNGYVNDVWVRLAEGYVSAVYLKGDQYGGLPASATC